MKCDELKPTCQRCKNADMKCDGYRPVITRIFEGSKDVAIPRETRLTKSADGFQRFLSSISLAGLYHLRLFPDATSEQQQAFCYFQQNTAPTLAAFTDNTEKFWLFHMPRFAVDDVAVFYCAVALAARHNVSQWRVKDSSSQPADSLRGIKLSSDSYSQAVRQLTVHQSHAIPERRNERLHVMLTCCALFIGYEAIQDPTATTDVCLTHIMAGFRILQQAEISTAAHPTGEDAALIYNLNRSMFGKLSVVLPLFTIPEKLMTPIRRTTSHRVIFPTSFHSTHEARASFVAICRCYWQLVATALGTEKGNKGRLSHTATTIESIIPAVETTKARMTRWWELFTTYNRSLWDSSNREANTDLERTKCRGYLTQFLILSNALRAATDPATTEACGTILACIDSSDVNKIVSTFRVTATFPMNTLKDQGATPNIMSGDEWLWPSLEFVSWGSDGCIVNATMTT